MPPRFDEPGVHFDDPRIRMDDPRSFQEILNQQTSHAMYDVVLDISGLNNAGLITRIRQITSGVAGKPAFASLATKLADLNTAVTALETAENAITAAKAAVTQAVQVRDEKKAPVIEQANELAADVGKLAPDEATVTATTLRVKSKPAAKPIPDKPAGLELTIGDEEGEITGHCDGQPGMVDYYELRWTTGDPNAPATTWTPDTCKKSSFELKPLPPRPESLGPDPRHQRPRQKPLERPGMRAGAVMQTSFSTI